MVTGPSPSCPGISVTPTAASAVKAHRRIARTRSTEARAKVVCMVVRERLRNERLERPAVAAPPEEAAIVQSIGGRAVPDVDLRGPETDAAEARGRRHGGSVGIAPAQLLDAGEERLARGDGLALGLVGVVVVLEEAGAQHLAIPPELEPFGAHGAELAVDAILARHARPENRQRALSRRLDLAPLGTLLVQEQAEPVGVHVPQRHGPGLRPASAAHGNEEAHVDVRVVAPSRLFTRRHHEIDRVDAHGPLGRRPQSTGSRTRRTPKRASTRARISAAKAVTSAARAASWHTMARLWREESVTGPGPSPRRKPARSISQAAESFVRPPASGQRGTLASPAARSTSARRVASTMGFKKKDPQLRRLSSAGSSTMDFDRRMASTLVRTSRREGREMPRAARSFSRSA